MNAETTPQELLQRARSGSADDLGELLEVYRHYLHLLAHLEIGRSLQAKLDASDLVQDTLLEAHRHFPAFKGSSETQFVCWLRQIMAGLLANLLRRYIGTKGRDVRLERELGIHMDQTSCLLDRGLIGAGSSPSQQASRRERAVLLADALDKLPDNYREVLILRHLEGLTFPEVSQRMGRTIDSVEKLWVRGLAQLRNVMGSIE